MYKVFNVKQYIKKFGLDYWYALLRRLAKCYTKRTIKVLRWQKGRPWRSFLNCVPLSLILFNQIYQSIPVTCSHPNPPPKYKKYWQQMKEMMLVHWLNHETSLLLIWIFFFLSIFSPSLCPSWSSKLSWFMEAYMLKRSRMFPHASSLTNVSCPDRTIETENALRNVLISEQGSCFSHRTLNGCPQIANVGDLFHYI